MGRKISRKKAKSDQKLFEKNSLVERKGSGVGGNGSSDKRRQGGNKTESLRAGSRVSGSSDKRRRGDDGEGDGQEGKEHGDGLGKSPRRLRMGGKFL